VEHAAETLLDLGLKREQDVWCKKIELSLGTMARVAGGKYSQSKGIILPDGGRAEVTAARNELGLVKIQDQVYNRILRSVKDAIDEKAELQLALEAFSNKSLKKQKRSTSLLDESMGRLIRHEAMDALTLIDLLTLMGDKEGSDDEEPLNGVQFHLALQATQYGIADKDEQNLVQRVIWRRCMLGDDWAEVNNTDMKDDQQVSEQLRKTALYKTLRACFKNGI
jgi:nuclear pore complex protein Nup133